MKNMEGTECLESKILKAQALRFKGDFDKAMSLLDEVVRVLDENVGVDLLYNLQCFVAGSAHEEFGLNLRYREPGNAKDLDNAIGHFNVALTFYDRAMDDTSTSPVLREEIKGKKYFRTIGIIAATIADLGSIKDYSDALEKKLLEGEKRINEEILWREKRNEKETFNIANAYHTRGIVRTEIVRENKRQYEYAKDDLKKAEEIFGKLGIKRGLAVIQLRYAWLEYRFDPTDVDAIRAGVNDYLNQVPDVPLDVQRALSYRLETLQKVIEQKAN